MCKLIFLCYCLVFPSLCATLWCFVLQYSIPFSSSVQFCFSSTVTDGAPLSALLMKLIRLHVCLHGSFTNTSKVPPHPSHTSYNTQKLSVLVSKTLSLLTWSIDISKNKRKMHESFSRSGLFSMKNLNVFCFGYPNVFHSTSKIR